MKTRLKVRSTPSITPGQLIMHGSSGLVPFGYCQQTTGSHVNTFIAGGHGNVTRVGPGVASGTTTPAGVRLTLQELAANGWEAEVIFYTISDPLPTLQGDAIGQEYVSAQLTTMLSDFPNLKYITMHNEPPSQQTALIQTQAWFYPLVKSLCPNAVVSGFANNNFSGVASRTTYNPTYIALGGLDTTDCYDIHPYGGGPNTANGGGPEVQYQEYICYIVDRMRTAKPTIKFRVSEVGWDTGAGATAAYKVTETQQCNYMGRGMFMYRCIPSLDCFSLYLDRDEASVSGGTGGLWGVYYIGGTAKPSLTYMQDALDHVKVFTEASAFTRPGFQITSHISGTWSSADDLKGGFCGLNTPWFVRGDVTGSKRLAAWYAVADTGSYSDSIFVLAPTAGGTTLNVKVIGSGSAPTTISLSPGLNTVPVTLTETPKVYYSSDESGHPISFPEFTA